LKREREREVEVFSDSEKCTDLRKSCAKKPNEKGLSETQAITVCERFHIRVQVKSSEELRAAFTSFMFDAPAIHQRAISTQNSCGVANSIRSQIRHLIAYAPATNTHGSFNK
jgi:hypothetical protein